MRFTTKTGLKLDANELKVLNKACEVLGGIHQHSAEPSHRKLACEGTVILGELIAFFSLDDTTVKSKFGSTQELPFEQAESGAA